VSKDYVADNAGTGFASFDDDGPSDLDSLLAGAALGEEPDDQDTSAYFGDSDQVAYTSQSEGMSSTSSSLQNSYSREELQPEIPAPAAQPIQIDDDEEYDDLPVEEPVIPAMTRRQRSWETDPNPNFSATAQEPFAASVSAPVSAPTPFVPPASVSVPEYSQQSSRRISIPSEADEIVTAGKVIRIIDAYRKLNAEVRSVALQFITGGTEVIEDEATLVVKVINADPMLSVTMRSLREAKALDPVERVFYVISLEDNVLHSLGGLVSVFNGTSLDETQNRISYARALVREVEQLEARAVNYVESTESILAAVGEESN
jgi:hypothetical protein